MQGRVRARRDKPHEAAASAGLRYVSDTQPGIRRKMGRLGFEYFDPGGRRIKDPARLKQILALAVPPAWKDVWICPDPRGHLQATGRDARGRKQYRYHPNWRQCRDETKFDRMQAFAAALPRIRSRTSADMRKPGLPREKVLATVVQLLEKSLIRVGNEEYARHNRSFGLTTMRDKHVEVKGGTVRFSFRGKSGIRHAIDLTDKRLAQIVRQCRDLPGQELFQYIDDDGRRQDVTSTDVNAYLRELTGQDFTAKDFRTWAGTVLAAKALRDADVAPSTSKAKKTLLTVIEAVAGVLGNTRTVCRKSYIHPMVIDAYMDGSLVSGNGGRRSMQLVRRAPRGLKPDEVEVLVLLAVKRPFGKVKAAAVRPAARGRARAA
jgi:DNA topoisomerase-1